MKSFLSVVLCFVLLALAAQPAEAAIFRGFGRNNVVAVNAGGASVNVVNQRRGLFGLRNRTQVFLNNGGRSNVAVVNNGFRRNNAVFVNNGLRNNNANVVVNNGFRRNNVVAVNVNGNHFNSFNNANRVNVFGTHTFVNNGGNVLEVDHFGNARVRGSAFRGFGTNGVVINEVSHAYDPGVNANVVVNNVGHGHNQAQVFAVNNVAHGHGNNVAVFRGFSSCSLGGCN